jgi:hypothetical protein
MKTILASLLVLFAFNANSRVLVVKEYGVNATYSTIAAALSASLDNDTIVIYDKPSGQLWLENIVISKNLTFLHPNQGTRFKVPGQVTIVPKAGMDLYFIGWDLNGNNITATANGNTATASNRAKITVTDCINVANIDLNVDWIDARISYNQTNITGNIYFRHGLAVANVLSSGGILTIPESTVASQNDSLIIVGNKARWCFFDSQECGLIANNYFSHSGSGSNSTWFELGQGHALLIRNHNQASNAYLTIVNNTIINSGSTYANTGTTRMGLGFWNCGTVSNIKILNNLIVVYGPAPNYGIYFEATSGASFISHNYINAQTTANFCNKSFNNELNYTTNVTNAYGLIDTWGRAGSGNTQLINKGNYLGEYYDIDLTRNDIGTYGGPYTIDNYLTSGNGKGKVLYINIQHQLTNLNQILNVKGSAGAKF